MPQADLSFSAEIEFDAAAALTKIEEVIVAHDASSGACKGRAHALEITHHRHVLLRLRMLDKPHRDDAFMKALVQALQTAISPLLPAPCIFGLEIGFLETHYSSLTID